MYFAWQTDVLIY